MFLDLRKKERWIIVLEVEEFSKNLDVYVYENKEHILL